MALTLPEEIIVEILLRLPVKSILQFKCISRQWRYTIDSPGFRELHLKKMDVFNYRDPRLLKFNNNNYLEMVTKDLKTPDLQSYYRRLILGPCNGLFCFVDWNDCVFLGYVSAGTASYYQLPSLTFQGTPLARLPKINWRSYGFGYDVENDGYKAICIVEVEFRDLSVHHLSYVYSLKLGGGEWKSSFVLEDHPLKKDHYLLLRLDPLLLRFERWGACVANTVRWRVKGGGSRSVLSFDLGNDEFTLLPKSD